jgi:hypothetical protein
MANIYQMCTNTRLRLGEPRPNRTGDALLLQQICSHIRNLLRQKQNTGNVWNFNDVPVDVTANQDTYVINVPDFGTPLAVYTSDPGNQNHITRLIPFFSPQNIFYNYGLPANFGAYLINADGSFNTALRCSFSWRNNQTYIQFLPLPKLACTYIVRYLMNADGVHDMALTQEPVEDADSDLVEIRSAKSLLSNSEWMAADTGDGRAYNSDKRKELLITLRDDELLAQRQFDAAQLLTTGPRIHTRMDFSTV